MEINEAVAWARRQRGPRGRPSFGSGSLTPTEQLVADQIAQGRTNAEIASALLVSVATVKTHVTRIFTKFGVRNRTELVATLRK